MPVDKGALQGREGVSFASSNLVRDNLSSRTRQQSEPPLNRNVFPPTPPPDDRSVNAATASGSQSAAGHQRSSSLRLARPPRLDLDRTGAALDRRAPDPSQEKPRIGTTRTASEPRGPSRYNNMRGFAEPVQNERSSLQGHRRNVSDTNLGFEPEYGQDPYSPQRTPGSTWSRGPRHQPPQFIEEEEEYVEGAYDAASLNGNFELVGAGPTQRRTASPARNSRNANPRRPEIQKFRTKVHAPDDTRYIMIGPTITFAEFENRIREKFGFKSTLKIKVQDDGDMITMVDQEDLDLLVSSAKEVAKREGSEMGKMEVSFRALRYLTLADLISRSGLRNEQ